MCGFDRSGRAGSNRGAVPVHRATSNPHFAGERIVDGYAKVDEMLKIARHHGAPSGSRGSEDEEVVTIDGTPLAARLDFDPGAHQCFFAREGEDVRSFHERREPRLQKLPATTA